MGQHSHGSGCHSASTSHARSGDAPASPSDTRSGDTRSGDDRKCGANYKDTGSGCEINYQPDPDTADCPKGTKHDLSSQLCVSTNPGQDPDVVGQKRGCGDDPRNADLGSGCERYHNPGGERSKNCPAGQTFYSTLGCSSPCDAGQILVGGSCRTVVRAVTRTPDNTPDNTPEPAVCQIGYTGTPPDCEKSTPQLFVLDATVAEDAGTVDVTVALSHAGTADTTATVSTADGTAVSREDYTAIYGQRVTIASGAQTATVTVTITDDAREERTETFTVTATSVTGGAVLGDDPAGEVTITDTDAATAGRPRFLALTCTVADGSYTLRADWEPPTGAAPTGYSTEFSNEAHQWGAEAPVGWVTRLSVTGTTASVTASTADRYTVKVAAAEAPLWNRTLWAQTSVTCIATVALDDTALTVAKGDSVAVTASLGAPSLASPKSVLFDLAGAVDGGDSCAAGADFYMTAHRFDFAGSLPHPPWEYSTDTAAVILHACDTDDTDDKTVTLTLTSRDIAGLRLGSPVAATITITGCAPPQRLINGVCWTLIPS